MPADQELSSILNRRQAINEALDEGKEVTPQFKNVKKNIFSEFHEFSRREIKEYEKTFNRLVRFIFKMCLFIHKAVILACCLLVLKFNTSLSDKGKLECCAYWNTNT
jgi:hypothetical protein